MPRRPALLLVPTPLELGLMTELGGFPGHQPEACGFGPVAAAARTAQLLARHRPAHVVLVGLAGALADLELGTALAFTRVRLDGVGVGTGAAFLPPARVGFAQWDGPGARVDDLLALDAATAGEPERELLTVCAASADAREAAARRERYPSALAEDMEGFGVALACRLAETPLTVVRGLSNRAGEREASRWQTREALASARTLALALLRVRADPPARGAAPT